MEQELDHGMSQEERQMIKLHNRIRRLEHGISKALSLLEPVAKNGNQLVETAYNLLDMLASGEEAEDRAREL